MGAMSEDCEKSKSIDILIQKKFLEARKVFLWGEINDDSAKDVTEKLVYLELESPGKDIFLYISTPGGSITAGMSIYDTIQLVSSPVTVVVTGLAASMGSILLCSAQKGRRWLYPHARVLIHQPLIMGRIMAPAVDIHIQAQEMEKSREEVNKILANASGQTLEKIRVDTDRDFYLSAEEAIGYGLADKIVSERFI
jgi:ATP-dependent Clp protease protease subunit